MSIAPPSGKMFLGRGCVSLFALLYLNLCGFNAIFLLFFFSSLLHLYDYLLSIYGSVCTGLYLGVFHIYGFPWHLLCFFHIEFLGRSNKKIVKIVWICLASFSLELMAQLHAWTLAWFWFFNYFCENDHLSYNLCVKFYM